MKKTLCIAVVLMFALISVALAGVVDSRENDDITEVEIIEIEYRDPDPQPSPTKPQPSSTPQAPAPTQPGIGGGDDPGESPKPTTGTDVKTSTEPPKVTNIDYKDPNLDPPGNPEIDIIHNPPEVEQLIEDLQTTYQVTVNYVALDGTPVGEPVKQQVDVGEEFTIPLPPVVNFQPVSDPVEQTMPARDVEYTVIYLPDDFADELIDINGYNTPLGIGNSVMNLGVCVE